MPTWCRPPRVRWAAWAQPPPSRRLKTLWRKLRPPIDRPFTKGLFRCAEALVGRGQPAAALAIYDRLNQPQAPRQVRDGASRKARILRQEKGHDDLTEETLIMSLTRRDMLRLALTAAGLALADCSVGSGRCRAAALPDATPKHLPRWRGFNLLDKFMVDQQKPFQERDFADIAELGFDFVRLPLDYRCWTDRENPKKLKEPVLKEIDQAVEFGRKHGVHVQINFHRAPGFTVAKPAGAEVALDRSPRSRKSVRTTGRPSRRGIRACPTTRSASTRSTSPTTRSSRRTTAA